MLNAKKVQEYLEKEGLQEIDNIKYKDNILVYNFFYQFDKVEIEAAEEYSNESCNKDKNNEAWYEEHYIPYLIDVAADNVKDTLDDMCEELNIQGEFVAYEIDRNFSSQCEFTIVIAEPEIEFDIDDVLEEVEI